MPRVDILQFCSIKCKLSSVLLEEKASPFLGAIRETVKTAHHLSKQGTAFFKAFCLSEGDVPSPVDHSAMVACLQQVSIRSPKGAKGKATELSSKMETFWKERFSKVYPIKVDLVGKSRVTAAVAEQMADCILTNATTHFEYRCRCLCSLLGVDLKKVSDCVANAFRGRWDFVDERVREPLQRAVPSDPANGNVWYDMKKRPSAYVAATFRLCQERKKALKEGSGHVEKRKRRSERDFCFAPLRVSCTPKHLKIDTETACQLFVPYREATSARKEATTRTVFNDWVWNKLLNRRRVEHKLRKGFTFHHEITTDGVSASILYSRPKPVALAKKSTPKEDRVGKLLTHCCGKEEGSAPPCKHVGLDPGKRNLATMTDEDGISLRYTARQRAFESKMCRYRTVLNREKALSGITELETKLSLHSSKTNDPDKFWEYLKAKKAFDESSAGEFYERLTWRNWKLRTFSARKSSEDKFLDRVSHTYGSKCIIFYGDWSRKDQMSGCDPSPVVGLRKAMRKRFFVADVDEHKTSKMCNRCMGELSSYAKKNGRRSYSRLCCTSCGGPKDRLLRFVDRDLNAAANILLVGRTLPERPEAFRRSRKRTREDKGELLIKHKKIKPAVDAAGSSNNPPLASTVDGYSATKLVD